MSKELHPVFEIARTTAWIQVCKPLMFALGNDEALIFGELLSKNKYFTDRDELTESGFFYNTVWDLASETNLNDHKQRLAINNLTISGLLETKVKGIPPKRFFKIVNNPELFLNIIAFGIEKARRVRDGLNSQIFKESILNNFKKPYSNNKPNSIDEIPKENIAIIRSAFQVADIYTDRRKDKDI